MDDLGLIVREFQNQNGWFWMVAAAALFTAEVLLPGVFLMWFGLAAVVTGAVLFAVPGMSGAWQIALFSLLSVISLAVGRQLWGSYSNPPSDQPNLNERGHQYVGRTFELTEAIRDGRGRAAVGDSTWLAKGPDLPAGTRVRVTGIDGTVLVVEKA